MLEMAKFDLRINETPKHCDLRGRARKGNSYTVKLVWDARYVLDAYADSPRAAGELVGAAIRNICESIDSQTRP